MKIETKPLPHKVGTADLKSAELKKVVMLLMEDIVFLKSQLDAANAAIRELQRR